MLIISFNSDFFITRLYNELPYQSNSIGIFFLLLIAYYGSNIAKVCNNSYRKNRVGIIVRKCEEKMLFANSQCICGHTYPFLLIGVPKMDMRTLPLISNGRSWACETVTALPIGIPISTPGSSSSPSNSTESGISGYRSGSSENN